MLVRLCSKSFRGLPGGGSSKEPTCLCRKHKRCRFNPWVEKIPWRRKWQPTPVLLTGESHRWRSLVGYRPWVHKELDMTEWLHFHFFTFCIFTELCEHPNFTPYPFNSHSQNPSALGNHQSTICPYRYAYPRHFTSWNHKIHVLLCLPSFT